MSIPIKTLTLPISSGGSTTETEYSFITPDDMDQKANVDGYYENLVSGGTEQLLSSVYEEDSEPYLFRTSGGSIDIGDREEDTIVGGTIAWNQIYQTHTSFSTTADLSGLTINVANGFIDVTGSTANEGRIQVFPITRAIPANHVCLMLCDGWNGFSWRRNGFAPVEKDYFMNRHSADWDAFSAISVRANTTYNIHARFSSYDLTQMFGSTIADYIYSLETATAGAGVAWFKKLFPKPYYEYNAGELLSVEGLQSHDMVGFNAWDEEWEMGDISSSSGANISSTDCWRTKNYIKVLPNTIYRVTAEGISSSNAIRQRFYDADKNFLGVTTGGGSQYVTTGSTFRTPVNACYMRFAPYVSIVPAGTKMCINLHWDGERDGEYEPYVKHSYPLDDSLTLRGIPKLDENNKLRCDGDVYHADGTVERRYGIVDLGTLNYNYDSTNNRFSTSNIPVKIAPQRTLYFMSDRYTTIVNQNFNIDWDMVVYNNNNIQGVLFHNHAYTDAASFKAAMSGVYLVYELATPTTEEAEPYQTPQIVDDFGTEEYVTDSIVPVGHVTKYMPNLKAKLEMAPDSPSDNGDYIVRHTNGLNEYVPLVIPAELPAMPTDTNGSYKLVCTVTNGVATLAWEAE